MDDKQSQLIYLKTTYQTMMDKPEQPCESSESYSFTACLKNSFSKRIGCRLEWVAWSSRDIPLCTTMEQLEQINEEHIDHSELQQKTQDAWYLVATQNISLLEKQRRWK
jgi:hypothetical protein